MTVYVLRNGKLVEKDWKPRIDDVVGFPMPRISRFEAMESPVTGKEITSWRERDRDMDAAGAVDQRDMPRGPIEKRKKQRARPDSAPLQWGRLDSA